MAFLLSPSFPLFLVYSPPPIAEIPARSHDLLNTTSPFPSSTSAVFCCSQREKRDGGTGVKKVHNAEERQGVVDWRGSLHGLQRV